MSPSSSFYARILQTLPLVCSTLTVCWQQIIVFRVRHDRYERRDACGRVLFLPSYLLSFRSAYPLIRAQGKGLICFRALLYLHKQYRQVCRKILISLRCCLKNRNLYLFHTSLSLTHSLIYLYTPLVEPSPSFHFFVASTRLDYIAMHYSSLILLFAPLGVWSHARVFDPAPRIHSSDIVTACSQEWYDLVSFADGNDKGRGLGPAAAQMWTFPTTAGYVGDKADTCKWLLGRAALKKDIGAIHEFWPDQVCA